MPGMPNIPEIIALIGVMAKFKPIIPPIALNIKRLTTPIIPFIIIFPKNFIEVFIILKIQI